MALHPGTRYQGVLEDIREEPLSFYVRLDDGNVWSIALADVVVRPGADVRAALVPALGQTVEFEIRVPDTEPPQADIWFPEPITEDDEVEYVSFLHLRTLLVRNRCIE